MNRNSSQGTALASRNAQPLNRWNPWSEFEQMRREMDTLMGGLIPAMPQARLAALPGAALNYDLEFSPDIYETAGEFVFVAPIPGLDSNDLQIEVTENTLTLKGERKPFFQQEGATQHRQSWWSARLGAFQASFTLPVEINAEGVQAHYRNGVLELHLPKAEPAKPKTVKVNISGNPAPATIESAPAGENTATEPVTEANAQ